MRQVQIKGGKSAYETVCALDRAVGEQYQRLLWGPCEMNMDDRGSVKQRQGAQVESWAVGLTRAIREEKMRTMLKSAGLRQVARRVCRSQQALCMHRVAICVCMPGS